MKVFTAFFLFLYEKQMIADINLKLMYSLVLLIQMNDQSQYQRNSQSPDQS